MPVTRLMEQLDLRSPVIQAPMAGGATSIDLVASVCEAGALGFLAAAYSPPEEILAAGSSLADRTDRPFGVNLFAPVPTPPLTEDHYLALDFLAPFHAELGLPPPELPDQIQHDQGEQFTAAVETGAAVLSFTFGLLPPEQIEAAKTRGMLVFGTATTVDEAVAIEEAGGDAVVAQGSEAGAHRGTFQGGFLDSLIGTMALVPQAADAVEVPVIASGGIMDGRGVVAALALGAEAVQMGTAFLTTHEAGIPDAYKHEILNASEHYTRLTTAFSGRPARGLSNRFISAADEAPAGSILPYPYQNSLTRAMRNAAAHRGMADYLSLWSGQGVRLARRLSVRELLDTIHGEMKQTLSQLGRKA